MPSKVCLQGMGGTTFIPCPHCHVLMELAHTDLNCGIYRHAVWKDGGTQIDPHAPRDVCEQVVREGLVHGCGKPFRAREARSASGEVSLRVEVCGYL